MKLQGGVTFTQFDNQRGGSVSKIDLFKQQMQSIDVQDIDEDQLLEKMKHKSTKTFEEKMEEQQQFHGKR